jgi:glyoxylase-like metal-dependent hydrolase (beta-lactamase superfamily II)
VTRAASRHLGALLVSLLVERAPARAITPAVVPQPAAPAASSAAPAPLRLYVLDCGTVIFNNPEAYSLTRAEVKNTNMSVACYLAVHPRGALLFDTGLPDSVAGRPFNESPLRGQPDPPSTAYFMLVTNTLRAQLSAIGFPPEKIDFLALSHAHRDHVGNANDYAGSTWLAQRAEYDAMFGPGVAPEAILPSYRSLRGSKVVLFDGDHDVFGDGTVVLKHTPGHTPGHQSLYVKLAKTGGVVLSGDLYHYPEERTLDRMPEAEKSTATPASRRALDAFLERAGAQLWIGHDITAHTRQRKAPAHYD